jgi:hypothetical protein
MIDDGKETNKMKDKSTPEDGNEQGDMQRNRHC